MPDSQESVPKSLWLKTAGSSPGQASVSNQSDSPRCENQPIRAVSRFNNTPHRQPEHVSNFSPGGWALAKMLREAPRSMTAEGEILTMAHDLIK